MTCSECENYRITKDGWCKCTGAEIDRDDAKDTVPWWCPLEDKEDNE